ncbi:MAG: hypothetical protein AB7O24_17405 [Kofleriaceae bacterium]
MTKPTEPDFRSLAVAVGDAWARELVHSLRFDDREIIGAWPGTMREARMRIRLAIRSKLQLHLMEELARVAYVSARCGWQAVSKLDPES